VGIVVLGSALTRSRGGAILFAALLLAALVLLAMQSSSGSAALVVGGSLGGLGVVGLGLWVAGRHERTREHAAMEEQLQTLRTASDLAGIGEWRWDLRTQRIAYGRGCTRMLGYDDGEIASTLSAWGKLAHPDDLPSVRASVDDLVEGRCDRYEHRVRLRAKDGTWRTIIDRGVVITRDRRGRPALAIGVHVVADAVESLESTCVVVDDDPDMRAIMEIAARRAGLDVIGFPDGDAAWRAIARGGAPKAIVTDFEMPGLSGLELADRVRAAGLRCPVLLVSGRLPTESELGAAVTGVLAKPTSLAELSARIAALVPSAHG
jgi:CheY-like chemotaxis protein